VYGESRMHGSEGREGAISKTLSFTRRLLSVPDIPQLGQATR
jgi:hypothetical protein